MDCVFEDGQTSFGLCCFNGCGNTCYLKTCKDVTEMVTETIIEQQCIGKLISISEMKKNLLNHILFYHNFCR